MEKFEYVIIGQGAAAFAAAIKANELGIKTAIIGKNETEGAKLGGTCVNVGCVPSKRLITVGNLLDKNNYRRFSGLSYSAKLQDFSKIIGEKEELVGSYRFAKYLKVLEKLENVKFIGGFGRFKDKNTIIVNDKEISAKKILIATGARTYIPKFKGIENIDYLTNETALSIKEVPKSIIIIGGRALGLEFAQMFAHFGSEVTVLQRSDRIIPNWEPSISSYLKKYLEEEGIKIVTNADIKEVKKENGIITVNTLNKEFKAEKLLLATGRTPNIEKLNLKAIDLKIDEKGFIKINNKMETSVKGIYAAGDVTGEPMLEALAAAEGNKAANNAFTKTPKRIDLKSVPSAIFTFPEAARVGLTDEEANKKGIKCACSPVMFENVAKAAIINDRRGLVKMVIDSKTKKVLGVEILGENAADIIHEATLIVKFGLTIDDIIDTVHMFPTLSESIKLAAQSFYHDINDLSCCSE